MNTTPESVDPDPPSRLNTDEKPSHWFPPGNNINPHGRGAGTLNRATRELKQMLDSYLFARPEYWANVVERIEAGKAPMLEALLIQLRYGRPKPIDAFALGDERPQIIIRIPRPAAELEAMGHTVEYVDAAPTDDSQDRR
jgi:hypothetical protein